MPCEDTECEVRGREQAEIALSSGHVEHCVCARGDVEKGSFWRHRRRCLIWMQLIRKVDWFDGTSEAGQQIHWSVKESMLRSIFTPSREALITILEALWRNPVFLFVLLLLDAIFTWLHKSFTNKILFALSTMPLHVRGETRWRLVLTVLTYITEQWFL